MTDKTTAEAATNELDAIVASLEELPDVEEEIVEEEAELLAEGDDVEDLEVADLNDEEVTGLELAIDKQASYETQSSDAVETANPERDGSTVAKKTGGKKKTSTPRVERSLNDIAPEHFVLTGDASKLDTTDLKSAKDNLMAAKPTQVKIAEKFENIIMSRAAGKKPSKYVGIAFNALEASTADPKTVTMSDIIAAYIATGLKDGTARSQAGQMMVLLPALGIATRNSKELTAVEGSNFAQFLRDLT